MLRLIVSHFSLDILLKKRGNLSMYFCCGVSVGDERAVCEADAGMRLVVRIYGFCADCAEFSNPDCDYFD